MRMFAFGLTAILLSACARSASAPTPPSNSAATPLASVDSIGMAPATDVLRIGETQQFTVTVELGPGLPPSGPAPLWISSDPSIVALTSSGVATGIVRGEATIQVTFRGRTANRRLQVLP
jgi:hypothetical protein